jgi:hypothetical protein
MNLLSCPTCGTHMTLGIWDNRTERAYCPRCVPPLPRERLPRSSKAILPGPEARAESSQPAYPIKDQFDE